NHSPSGEEHRVQGHPLLKSPILVSGVADETRSRHADVVVEDVDAAVSLDRGGHPGVYELAVGGVSRRGCDPCPFRYRVAAHARDQGIERIGPDVVDPEGRALLGETTGHGRTDPRRRPADQRHFATQQTAHRGWPASRAPAGRAPVATPSAWTPVPETTVKRSPPGGRVRRGAPPGKSCTKRSCP